jgi:hypothetical protein
MTSLEHSTIKEIENECFGVECSLNLYGMFPLPLKDVIKFTFTAAKIPGLQMMTELIFVQNHSIKYIFDKGLSGELCGCARMIQVQGNPGSLFSEIKTHILASTRLN